MTNLTLATVGLFALAVVVAVAAVRRSFRRRRPTFNPRVSDMVKRK